MNSEQDRPSRHGALLGEALALIAMAGWKDFPGELREACLTCAFREGSQPNQSTGTGMLALNCVLGIDKDRFACHHGMKNGEPKRICSGYIAAKLAPWSFTKEVLASLYRDLAEIGEDGPDEVRAAFDAWLAQSDPNGEMDVYQQARAFAARPVKTAACD
jgi:hypothetical protein